MTVFWVLWPLTCIIRTMSYLWLRYMLVIPVRRAVWLVTHLKRGRSTLPFRSVSGSLPSFFRASFCFIVRFVGSFSFSVGTLSDSCIKNILDVMVQHLLVGFWDIVAIFITDGNKALVHHRDCHLCPGPLLNKPDNACAFSCGLKIITLRLPFILHCGKLETWRLILQISMQPFH